MSETVVLTGIVLTAMPVGDYDKRITILTLERGKITAFARGAKRPNNQLMACSNPFVFGQFELLEGKHAYTLSRASIKQYFRELTADPLAAYTGFYLCEFAEFVCQENNDEREMMKLLYQSLRALGSDRFSKDLVRMVFELKAMYINGEGPTVSQCIHCKRKDHLQIFSTRRGGVFCSSCGLSFPGRVISDAALYTMQYIAATPTEKVFSFALKQEVLEELTTLMKEYMEYYVHHRFRSLKILEEYKELL